MTEEQREVNRIYKAALAMLESIGLTVLVIENNREDKDADNCLIH